MAYTSDDLAAANRHVLEAEDHVSRQREIIYELTRDGHPTELATTLLHTFERTLSSHRQLRDQIAMELKKGSSGPA